MVAFTLNGKRVSVATEPDTPLLWAVREHLKLTGTKYGCGEIHRHWPAHQAEPDDADAGAGELGHLDFSRP